MPYPVAVRFVLGGSNIDFYGDEVLDVTEHYVKDTQVHESQTRTAQVYQYGSEVREINITFIEANPDTRAKINQLEEAAATLTLYPYYSYDATVSLTVIPMFDGDVYTYLYGELAAMGAKQMSFLEA